MLRTAFLSILLLIGSGVMASPDFTLQDLQGKTHSLSDYRGKWVVINYWATWCPPCRDELPELVDFHERHKDHDAVVLGFNSEHIELDRLREFVNAFGVSFPVFADSPETQNFAPVFGLPTTVLVDPQGQLVGKKTGPVTAEGIEAFIKEHQ